jgi:tetraacyldisaccharide 4'-kinase
MFKTPSFWRKPNLLALALSPFCVIYLSIFFLLKFFFKPKAVNSKVICVGNLTAGGQGKTPCALAIGLICDELKIKYAFLSRGYGVKFNEELRKVNANDSASEFGDEPILLSRQAPTFIAKNRYQGAKILSENNNFQLLILDDGLQNNSLKKDLKIAVIDEKIMFGNNLVLPAGPLREPASFGLKNVDLIIYIAKKDSELPNILKNKKLIRAETKVLNFKNFSNKKIIAFCGIAYPQKFFSTLQDCNLDIIQTIIFADHHAYSQRDLEELAQKLSKAKENQSDKDSEVILLTTKKDWIKFSLEWQSKIPYLDIAIKFNDENLLKFELKKLLKC